MPENPSPGLVDILMEAGPIQHASMGSSPLSAVELRAWQQGSGVDLSPWEFRQVLRLSLEYLAELQRAADEMAPPPWIKTPSLERRVSVAKNIRNVLRD